MTGTGPLASAGDDQGHMNIDLDVRVGGVVDVTEELFADNGVVANFPVDGLDHFPGDFRGVLRDAAEDFTIEVFDDLGAALFGPLRGRGDLLSVLQGEGDWQIGIRVGGGLVVVGVIGRGFGAAGTGAQGLDAEVGPSLNRAEYANAIRDLLSLEIDSESLLPADNSGYGFDNMGDVLSVSPTLLEEYMAAAGRSTASASSRTARPITETYSVSKLLKQDDRMERDLPFGSRGGIAVKHDFPLDGQYVIKITLQRNARSYIRGLAEQNLLDVGWTVLGSSYSRSEGSRRANRGLIFIQTLTSSILINSATSSRRIRAWKSVFRRRRASTSFRSRSYREPRI